jgi:hypothetical protein
MKFMIFEYLATRSDDSQDRIWSDLGRLLSVLWPKRELFGHKIFPAAQGCPDGDIYPSQGAKIVPQTCQKVPKKP